MNKALFTHTSSSLSLSLSLSQHTQAFCSRTLLHLQLLFTNSESRMTEPCWTYYIRLPEEWPASIAMNWEPVSDKRKQGGPQNVLNF